MEVLVKKTMKLYPILLCRANRKLDQDHVPVDDLLSLVNREFWLSRFGTGDPNSDSDSVIDQLCRPRNVDRNLDQWARCRARYYVGSVFNAWKDGPEISQALLDTYVAPQRIIRCLLPRVPGVDLSDACSAPPAGSMPRLDRFPGLEYFPTASIDYKVKSTDWTLDKGVGSREPIGSESLRAERSAWRSQRKTDVEFLQLGNELADVHSRGPVPTFSPPPAPRESSCTDFSTMRAMVGTYERELCLPPSCCTF
jgi:hypothetical protein